VADLSFAELSEADLSNAKLMESDLTYADLSGADLSEALLSEATFEQANLSGADLTYADLTYADLSRGADLSGTDLSGADLRWAWLGSLGGGTNHAQHVKEMLEQQAKSLRGAIMPDGTIYPGRYTAREFEPAVSFEVGGEGRYIAEAVTPTQIDINGPKGSLVFTNPRDVWDPSKPSEEKELPAPENATEWVSWFQRRHPNLDTSKPVPVSVGGASGKLIDVTYASTSEKNRFIFVDVGGETVLIDVVAPVDKFDEFSPKAQKVLDSVEWNARSLGPYREFGLLTGN
jgi:hypothetical protein